MWVLGALVLAVAGFASASQPWSSALVVLAAQVPAVAVVAALLWGRYDDDPEPAVAGAVGDVEGPAAVAGPDELAERRAQREAS